jgi:steroid delta-isomerase-like uncharacterized protein
MSAESTPEAVAREFVDAFNAGDWERFERTLAADVAYEETGTGRHVNGRPDYVELSRGWKTAFPDVVGEVRRVAATGDTVVQDVVWRGTHTGPLATASGEVPATGNHVEVDGCMWYDVGAGEVTRIRHFLDVLAILQQVGALPTPG